MTDWDEWDEVEPPQVLRVGEQHSEGDLRVMHEEKRFVALGLLKTCDSFFLSCSIGVDQHVVSSVTEDDFVALTFLKNIFESARRIAQEYRR